MATFNNKMLGGGLVMIAQNHDLSDATKQRYLSVGIHQQNLFCVAGNTEEIATMTKTGERIVLGVPTILLVILFISLTDWAKALDNPGQLQKPDPVVLVNADG